MKVLNYTPHEVIVYSEDDTIKKIIPSSGIARCTTSTEVVGNVNGVPLKKTIYGAVEGLPAPQRDTMIIVSSLVLGQAKDREDLMVPTDYVRDEGGRILGCKAFSR